ncbi:hypothetical protein [Dyadobacter sp. OTU695]|uniref:hypothetical protein n=1 Tax=Dyadobacter sp. OTU695 TaxID=3043860 RepID=UPI00313D204A
MKHLVLENPAHGQEIEGEELGLILNGLVDGEAQEQTLVLAVVIVTVLAGMLLVGTGLYLSIVWGV